MSYWKEITNIVDEEGQLIDENYNDLLRNLNSKEFGEFLADGVGLRYQSTIEFLVNTLLYVTHNVDKFNK